MPIYCNNLWQKLLMNLWAICTHKFRAQKKEFFYDFFGIIKNNVFFCINLCLFIALIYEKKMIINLRAICTHYFMAKKSISLEYRPLLSPPSFQLRISWALIFFPLWSMFYYVNRLTTDTKPAFLAVFKTEILVLWLRNHLMPRSHVFPF